MTTATPYGDPQKAKVYVIGHDPRLKNSNAEANYVFFLDLLESPPPGGGPQKAKYNLACSVIEYVMRLTSWRYSISEMYFTNLCNEFLKHAPKGHTILISDEVADSGIQMVENAIASGAPKLILPMSLQVFYHMVRTNFVTGDKNKLGTFIQKAMPREKWRNLGAYMESGAAPFLDVCGVVYYHNQVPVIPVLHIKSWSRVNTKSRYYPLMNNAIINASKAIKT